MNSMFYSRRLTRIATLFLIGFFLALSPLAVHATMITVDTTDHGVVIDGECSLVEAILAANTNTGGNGCPAGDDTPVDTIVLATDAFYSVTSSYTPTLLMTGLPVIESTIVVSGNGAIIERTGIEQLRLFTNEGNLTLQDVTLRYGSATDGGAILNDGGGLTVVSSRIISNTADRRGGGIYNSGSATITDTLIISNIADATNQFWLRGGGGISNVDYGTLEVINSTIAGNQASKGGGLETQGDVGSGSVLLTGTLVVDNISNSSGGGIYTYNTNITLMNTRVAANKAETSGGGIYIESMPTSRSSDTSVIGSEIISNTATNGGGIYNQEDHELHTIMGTDILFNRASSNGGGVYNRGRIVISGTKLSTNFAGLTGGGFYQVEGSGGTSIIDQSCIMGNSATAVNHASGSVIDARNNWWGVYSGPSGVASGAGDSVSENVAYNPYLTSAILGCPTPDVLGLSITKSASTSNAFVGEVITYTYYITNTGTETFTTISAVDDHLGVVGGLDGELPPQVTQSATLTYVVALNDFPGTLVNTVVVTGVDALDASITKTISASVMLVAPLLNWSPATYTVDEGSGTFTATVIMSPPNPYAKSTVEVTISDTAGINPMVTQVITFPANSSSQSVVIQVVDDEVLTPRQLLLGLQAPSGAALGDVSSANVTIIENDVALGLQVTKSTNTSHATVGESIYYTYRITNTGAEALTVINAVDDHQGLLAALVGGLAPRESRSITLSYIVQGSDLPGPLVNTVVVTGSDEMGNTIIRSATATVELDDFTVKLPHIQR